MHTADDKERERQATPAISVIIPAFNAGHFLPETLESVLRQTYTDLEVIVVDDGSTDGTADKAKSYLHDPRVHYIHQENKGVCAARNTGIRKSEGEFVALLDADDVWYPQKLERQVPLFEDDDIGLVYCMIEHIDDDDNVLPHLSWPHPVGATYKDLLYINWIVGSGSSVVIRKDVFDRVGLFDEDLKGLEDMDMWIRILRHYKSAYADSVLVKIRRHIRADRHKKWQQNQSASKKDRMNIFCTCKGLSKDSLNLKYIERRRTTRSFGVSSLPPISTARRRRCFDIISRPACTGRLFSSRASSLISENIF